MAQIQITEEIRGIHCRIHFTLTENVITIQKVATVTDPDRDIMKIMDKEILQEIHEKLVHNCINQAV